MGPAHPGGPLSGGKKRGTRQGWRIERVVRGRVCVGRPAEGGARSRTWTPVGRGRFAVNRDADTQGWNMVRKAIQAPAGEACPSPERLHREVKRLQARLERVQSRGRAYRGVEFSGDVRELLARLEAGATLSAYVH